MGKLQLLVVDDEVAIRSSLSRWFQERGFDVQTAADGMEAVDFCESQAYDVITMDLEMPRMDGITAIEAIRKIQSSVPILVITGLPRDTARAIAAGASKILMKPLRLRELEREIRSLLGEH